MKKAIAETILKAIGHFPEFLKDANGLATALHNLDVAEQRRRRISDLVRHLKFGGGTYRLRDFTILYLFTESTVIYVPLEEIQQ